MYRNIVVGYDGSAQAEDALAFGTQLAKLTDGSLSVALVLHLDPWLGAQNPALEADEVEPGKRLDDAAARVGARAERVLRTSPGSGLYRVAEARDADLLILGSSHRGKAGQVLAGSVGIALLHGAPCPVAIAPHGYADTTPDGISHVSVGFDGSPEASIALAGAVELARAAGAPLKVVTVAEPPAIVYGKGGGANYGWEAITEEVKGIMRARLDDAVASLPDDVEVEATLLVGKPRDKLAETAAASGGVLVLGSRGYGPVRRVLLGSVSADLVRSAPCPVIVHPRSAKPDSETREATATATA